jgi:hypothetical protein
MMAEQVRELKTRCYYTEYVNHMVRFYLTTPDTLKMDGKRSADIANWLAVQAAMQAIKPEDREIVTKVYKTHFHLTKAVEQYCQETGADQTAVWKVMTKFASIVARQRNLV